MLAPEEVVGPLCRPSLHHHPLRRADRPELLRRAESRGPPLEHRREGAGLGVSHALRGITGRINTRSVCGLSIETKAVAPHTPDWLLAESK